MDVYQERSPFGVAVFLEHRGDRSIAAYDQTTPASVLHPNGTVLATGDYALSSLYIRAVHHLCEVPS